MPKFEFRIRGMDCAEEVGVLRREIGPLVGGEVLIDSTLILMLVKTS